MYLSWLFPFFRRPSKREKDIFWLYIKCQKCGEKIKICVHTKTDLLRGYTEGEPPYSLHKEAMDTKCMSMITILISYDKEQNEVSREIHGGEFITEEEFLKSQ